MENLENVDQLSRSQSAEEKVIKEIEENKLNDSWIDIHLSEIAMNHLWDSINNSQYGDARKKLAGHISKSMNIQDKDNWFYNNILKEIVEYDFFRNWINYYEIVVTKLRPPPVFTLNSFWVNYQKQHEFNPAHDHTGLYSFVVFMKIPTHWKEQHKLPLSVNSNSPLASNFQFQVGHPPAPNSGSCGIVLNVDIPLSPEDEGRMLFFPAKRQHQVYPFYECEEERITISGNISLEPQGAHDK